MEKINSLLRNLAASFFKKEIKEVIVTITRIETSNDLKSAKIFISIFPDSKEEEVFNLLKEKIGELRYYIGSQIKIKFIPYLELEIYKGEKAQRNIEKLLSAERPNGHSGGPA